MRVTSSPIPCPAGAARSSDLRPPSGEPFRSALHAAGTAGQPGALPGALADPPTGDDVAEQGDHPDDTMVPAAAQVAYLARLNSRPGAAQTGRTRSVSSAPAADPTSRDALAADLGRRTGRATPADSLETVAAALALGSLGAPPPGAAPAAPLDSAAELNRRTAPPHFPEAALDPMTAATLRAAYGLPAEAAPPVPSASTPASPAADPPVAAWTASAIGRAISTLDAAALRAVPAETPNPDAVDAAPVAGASIVTAALPDSSTALTPLEQAVHDLVGRLDAIDPPRGRSARAAPGDGDTELAALPIFGAPPPALSRDAAAPAPAALAAHAAPAAAEPPANPSHVHLVIDDGPERVVATIAVRGSEVHVTLRATDEATAAALARNAGSLDHAMQGRGLQLGELTAERDREPRDHRPPQDGQPRERRPRDAEKFELEDKP